MTGLYIEDVIALGDLSGLLHVIIRDLTQGFQLDLRQYGLHGEIPLLVVGIDLCLRKQLSATPIAS